MSNGINLNDMFTEMEKAADRAEKALDGQFSDIYKELRNLSPDKIDSITPDTTDQKEYERMIALVQEATERNLDKVQLVEQIKEMGTVAMSIARMVPTLAALL
jgi:predicted nuclease with TOPRIM domain